MLYKSARKPQLHFLWRSARYSHSIAITQSSIVTPFSLANSSRAETNKFSEVISATEKGRNKIMAEGPILLQKDNTFTKLFVGGLPYHTTNETLRDYFLQFGDIEEAVVIHDRVTLKSKGYGFVTMKDKEGAERACVDPYPIIDGRKANVNLAYLGAKPKPHSQPTSPLAIFPLTRSDSPNGLFTGPQHSPPQGLPLPPPGFFLPSPPPPPHPHFFQDGPPFSPPLFNPILFTPFFNGSPPPFGYLPPTPPPPHLAGPHFHNFMPQIVPFNAAN